MTHSTKAVRKYFEQDTDEHLWLEEQFTPGKGWEPHRVALTNFVLQGCSKAGVTIVAIRKGERAATSGADRIADFNISELTTKGTR